MLPANGRVFDALLQEVTDMIDKTSVAIDLVRSELKRSTATVTVSLTVPPCVQSGSVDRQQKSGSSPRLDHDEDSCKEVLVELLSDNYQDLMIQTVWEVDKELKLARQLLGQCKESFSSLVSFYGENAQAFANDAVFWSDVVAFVQNFTACQRALRKQMQVWLSTVLPGVSFDPG